MLQNLMKLEILVGLVENVDQANMVGSSLVQNFVTSRPNPTLDMYSQNLPCRLDTLDQKLIKFCT